MNNAKISTRPTIKITEQKIFAASESLIKTSGSTIPGKLPTFVKHTAEIPTASENCEPVKLKIPAHTNKVMNTKKKYPKIRPTICGGTAVWFTRTEGIICGWIVFFSSAAVVLNNTKTRINFKPPVTEPIQPPHIAIRKTKNLSKSGVTSKGVTFIPVVLIYETMWKNAYQITLPIFNCGLWKSIVTEIKSTLKKIISVQSCISEFENKIFMLPKKFW